MEYEMIIAVKAMRVQSSLGTVGRAVQAGVRGLVMLFVLACCVLRAEEAVQAPVPESVADFKASASAPVPLNWTSSDLVALGLIVLGATVVFIPVPKFRSEKPVQKPTEAPVREVCRTAPLGGRSSLGADRTTMKQTSTI